MQSAPYETQVSAVQGQMLLPRVHQEFSLQTVDAKSSSIKSTQRTSLVFF